MDFSAFKDASILVAGGVGFIGSNLAIRLVSLGAKVTIIDSFLDGGGANEHNLDGIRDKIKVIKADLSLKSSAKYIKGFDYIFNLAAQTGHKESLKDPFLDFRCNALASLNLLEAVRINCPGAMVVYAGTRDQYGKIQKNPVDESHPIIPTDPNGVSKQAAEEYHFLYHRLYSINACSLRLTNVYGPRVQIKTSKQGFIGWFISLALQDKDIEIFGDGSQMRDIIYVDDVVDVMLMSSLSKDAIGQVFNVAYGRAISVMDIAKETIKSAGSGRIKKVAFPDDNKKIEIGDFIGDISKAKKMLGWIPKTDFESGIKKTIDFYKENMKLYL